MSFARQPERIGAFVAMPYLLDGLISLLETGSLHMEKRKNMCKRLELLWSISRLTSSCALSINRTSIIADLEHR